MKTVSEKIFEFAKERVMTQKDYLSRTGITESMTSDWKRKTNPTSDTEAGLFNQIMS